LVAWPRPLVSMDAYELDTLKEMFKYLTFEYREAALTFAWNDSSWWGIRRYQIIVRNLSSTPPPLLNHHNHAHESLLSFFISSDIPHHISRAKSNVSHLNPPIQPRNPPIGSDPTSPRIESAPVPTSALYVGVCKGGEYRVSTVPFCCTSSRYGFCCMSVGLLRAAREPRNAGVWIFAVSWERSASCDLEFVARTVTSYGHRSRVFTPKPGELKAYTTFNSCRASFPNLCFLYVSREPLPWKYTQSALKGCSGIPRTSTSIPI
jgi:hypothetical protein